MLIGYVSDERYVALPDVIVEFLRDGKSIEARSRATGAVHADLPAGPCEAVICKPGYGSKRVQLVVRTGNVYQFRLLSDCLLGYVWPKWIKSGEEAEFRVHSVEAYQLELWRYGAEKEFVRNLGWHDEHGPRATMQITPDGDYTQTGVHFNEQGYHIKVHRQAIEAPAKSGLYYFHVRTAAGAHFSFPWIVAPARPAAKMAVLASNITWNAYNSFGGRSNYIHADRLPPTPTINSRQELKRYTDPDHLHYAGDDYDPLSFDRPEPINSIAAGEEPSDPIEGRAACHVAPAEWRLLAWLERQKFDYDLYAETQLHHENLNLSDYRVLVLSAHPEYWSRKMYDRVKRWVRDEGGKLIYLGGNGLNCEVEFADATTIVCRNGDQRKKDSQHAESRFHLRYESEANLLGVAYSDPGAMTAAPYRVVDADHWAFAGAGLKRGDVFGTRSLHRRCEGGASGHETDKITPSSPKNVRLLAKGLNRDEGGAEMVYYDTRSGGEVFSVGSITWVSCLLVDDAVSTITANVVRWFAGAS